MKIVIFAGGHGTRFWPLSRKNSPKQFEKMFDGKSTLQLMVDRVKDTFGIENIYISTGVAFKDVIKEQLPDVLPENIIYEPARRDLAAAVGLSFLTLQSHGITEPVTILWSDHLIENTEMFVKALKVGEKLITENPNRFVFNGEIPRFANNNLGWISMGEVIENKEGFDLHSFKGWVYKPDVELCNKLFESKTAVWNTGYFVTSVDFVTELYKEHMPEMYSQLKEANNSPQKLEKIYPNLEAISFDDAIVKKSRPDQGVVLTFDIGWSDPGRLYSLKEALTKNPTDNHLHGNVVAEDITDSLVYNQDPDKIVAAIGLDGFVVVNTKDAVLVCHKDNIREITGLLKKLEAEGFSKYL